MKTIKLIVAATLLIGMLQSCDTNQPNGGPQTAYLHLQGGFDHDDVRIDLDGVQVYHYDSVTTNNLLSLADVDSTIQSYGNHQISVNVNNTAIHTENFDLHQSLWLGINLNPADSSIQIDYSLVPFMYE